MSEENEENERKKENDPRKHTRGTLKVHNGALSLFVVKGFVEEGRE